MRDDDFVRLIESMTQTLYRVCCTQLRNPSDREDAVQEALRRAWEKRHSLRNDDYAQTWVIRILLNECDRIRRKQAKCRPQPVEAATHPQETAGTIKQAVQSLPDGLRETVLLHYLEGYSVEAVARMLRIPTGTAKSRLHRGRRELRRILDEEIEE